MEAAGIIRRIRALSGITRTELAHLADVSPSTVSRIERGELDPTWGTMNKILQASGYQLNGESIVASGDTSAIRAASPVFAPVFQRFYPQTTTTKITAPITMAANPWVDRWNRAGWLSESAGFDGMLAIAVTAGNTGSVARRSARRVFVEVEGGWRSLVEQFKVTGVDYSVSGLVATWEDRSVTRAGTPLVYVRNPTDAATMLGLTIVGPGRGILLLEAVGSELEEVEEDGGVLFAPRSRALLDAFAGLGRDPDKAEDLLRGLWEVAA